MRRTERAGLSGLEAPGRAADGYGPLPAWLLLAMVAVIGVNLRAVFGSVPASLDAIGRDLALNATTAALLTSVPVLCMGLFAPVAQRLAIRIGPETAAAALLVLLALSGLMRFGVGSTGALLLSVGLSGVGMGGVSALMPGLIAQHLPRIPGTATGIYSMAMAGGVALAAWIAGPTAELLGGWRPALALWGVVAGLAALGWAALVPRLRPTADGTRTGAVRSSADARTSRVRTGGTVAATPGRAAPGGAEAPTAYVGWPSRRSSAAGIRAPAARRHRLPWRSPIARWVTSFTTLNMLIGFGGVAWIAPTFVHHGFEPQRAAGLYALFQCVQIAAMLTLPPLTDVIRDRRPLLAVTAVCTLAGVAAMLLAPAGLALLAVLLFGTGVGGASSLALVLVQDASSNQEEAGRLGAMVLLVSFLAGAAGPLLLGTLRDFTGGFSAGYGVLLTLAILNLLQLPVFRPGRKLSGTSDRPDPRRTDPGSRC